MTSLRAAALLLVSLALPPAALQGQFELGPLIGFYAPTSTFDVRTVSGIPGNTPAKQNTSIAFGGFARVWLDRRFGVTLSLAQAASDLGLSPSGSLAVDTTRSASVRLLTLVGNIRFTPASLSNPLWIEVGAASVHRSGEAYDGYEGTTSLGGVLGLGTSLGLTQRVRADVGLQALVYHLALRDGAGTLPAEYQVDLNARVGMTFLLP